MNSRHQQRALASAQQAAEQQSAAQMQEQLNALQAQQVQAEMHVPATDIAAQLAQLAQLQHSGVLSEQEFNAAKAKILGL